MAVTIPELNAGTGGTFFQASFADQGRIRHHLIIGKNGPVV